VIELRALTSEEWRTWRELRLTALRESPDAFDSRLADWRGDRDREERWRARLEIPGSYNVVAMLDARPVGMASGVPTSEDGVAELISMWVSPAARGRGVGDELIGAVERWARQSRARVLRLCVMPGNEPAIRLYRRNGFANTGEQGDPLPDGAGSQLVLAKALTRPHDKQGSRQQGLQEAGSLRDE
jgi:ribosomal protein S18 acetylase RimI-like enzyme